MMLENALRFVVADTALTGNENHSSRAEGMQIARVVTGTGGNIHARDLEGSCNRSDGLTDREREFERHLSPPIMRAGLAYWAFFAKRPRLYGVMTAIAARLLSLLGSRSGRFRWLPLASAWTRDRDFPAPQGAIFQSQWKRRRR